MRPLALVGPELPDKRGWYLNFWDLFEASQDIYQYLDTGRHLHLHSLSRQQQPLQHLQNWRERAVVRRDTRAELGLVQQ